MRPAHGTPGGLSSRLRFERHACYGTKDHERAITRLGVCDQHPRSVKKLAELADAGESDGAR